MRFIELVIVTSLGASTLTAQPTGAARFELSAGVSHFAQYVSADAQTRQTGPTVALVARLRASDKASKMELAYTTVRQKTTTASAAPRLDVARISFGWQQALEPAGRVSFDPSLGAAWLHVDAQTVDCGAYPLCSEWAPYDASLLAGVVGLGLSGQLGRLWTLRAGGIGYLPVSTWQPGGWQSLLELRLTLGARF